MADEIGAPIITATQTSDVPFEVWNNPDKVIDRSYTEGDKTLVKPFSFVFTLNMTIEEKENATARIYVDKLRDYKESQEVITIATNYDKRRFYHRGRTMEMYNQISERKEVKNRHVRKRRKQRKWKAFRFMIRIDEEEVKAAIGLRLFGSQGWLSNKNMDCPYCGKSKNGGFF